MARELIVGASAALKKVGQLQGAILAAAKRAVREEVTEVKGDLWRNAPYDTGQLREGLQAEIGKTGVTATAASTAAHTKYVVYGTSKTPAQDFMTPAAIRSRRRFPQRVRDEVAEEIRKAAK